MSPYWVLFGVFALASLMTRPNFDRHKPLGLLLVFGVLLALMIGLRDRVGMDWGNYLRAWNLADQLSMGSLIQRYGGDPAFYGLMTTMSHGGLPYGAFNLVCAGIFTWGLVAYARTLPNPWLAITVAIPYLVIAIGMSSTRQATALGLTLLALVAFSQLRTKAFLAWTAAAALFHASAILTLPLAGLSFSKSRFQSAVLIAITAAGGYYLLNSTFDTYAESYVRYTIQSQGTIYRVAMGSLAAGLYFLVVKRHLKMSPHESVLYRNYALVALAAFPMLFVVSSTTALDRMLLYVFPLQIMALSVLPYVVRPGLSYILSIMGVLGYLAATLFVFLNFGHNASGFIPYRMYWF